MGVFSAPFQLFHDFFSLLKLSRGRNYGPVSIIVVHFISLDALIAILFKKILGYRVILYAIGSDVLGITNPIQLRFLGWIISKADKVLCVNHTIERRIRRMGRAPIVVLPTPFSEPALKQYYLKKECDIITVGALEPFKKHDLLIEACAYLTSKASIAIVGDGSCKSYLENLAKLSPNHSFRFLGQITHEKVWSELQKARVYVHMSFREGIPSSILEAIWCQLPVIVVSSSYVDDLTRVYGFSLMVASRSPESLAIAIEKVLSDPEKWKTTTLFNRALLKEFISSWDSTFSKMLTQLIYRRI